MLATRQLKKIQSLSLHPTSSTQAEQASPDRESLAQESGVNHDLKKIRVWYPVERDNSWGILSDVQDEAAEFFKRSKA